MQQRCMRICRCCAEKKLDQVGAELMQTDKKIQKKTGGGCGIQAKSIAFQCSEDSQVDFW